eukprot:403355036
MDNTTQFMIALKVTVIGDPGAGKSAFLQSLQNNKEIDQSIQEPRRDHSSDEFQEVYVRDFKNNVQIVFQFTSDMRYISQSVCCILMYDISNFDTFESIQHKYFDLAQQQMVSDCSFIYLIGNKMDVDINLRQVELDQAQEFAQSKGILFNEVSSLKRKNIELVLKMLRTRTARLLSENKDLSQILENNAPLQINSHRQSSKNLSKHHDQEIQQRSVQVQDKIQHQVQSSNFSDQDDNYDLDYIENRMISIEDRHKISNQSSNMNTQQITNIHKQLDTAQRQVLNNILEQKLYQSSTSNDIQADNINTKDQSLSLNDINQMMMNYDFNNNQQKRQDNLLDDINLAYGMDETDVMEDDKLLQSLEKRFKNIESQNKQQENQLMMTTDTQDDFKQYAIRTDESPNLYKTEDQIGQTPQFQIQSRFNTQSQHDQQNKQKTGIQSIISQSSALNELQNVMFKYDNQNQLNQDSFQLEDRFIPYQQNKVQQLQQSNLQQQDKEIKQPSANYENRVNNQLKDNEFIKSLDNDIRKTEESLKEMNDRFDKIKQIQHSSQSPLRKSMSSISPIKKFGDLSSRNNQQDLQRATSNKDVPVFEASLFKSFDQRLSQQNLDKSIQNNKTNSNQLGSQLGNKIKSRNAQNNYHPLLTDRPSQNNKLTSASFIVDHKEKPLISLRIKLSSSHYVSASVYKDDTPQSVADRVFRHANIKTNTGTKDQRKLLAQVIESQVNAYISQLKEVVDKQNKDLKLQQKQLEQIEREKRLQEAAQRSIEQMNTAKRQNVKEDKKNKVLCKLSVIVGASKKGDIVAREGDNLQQLVKSFMQSYGLKKELMPTIISSLEQLIKNNEEKRNQQTMMKNRNNIQAKSLDESSMYMEGHELKLNDDLSPYRSFNNQTSVLYQDHSPENKNYENRSNQLHSNNQAGRNVFGIQNEKQTNNLFSSVQKNQVQVLDQSNLQGSDLQRSTISRQQASRQSNQSQGQLLFRLNFEIGEGKTAKINVREGDNFKILAQQFVQEHNMGVDAVQKVQYLIEQTYKTKMQQQQNQQTGQNY